MYIYVFSKKNTILPRELAWLIINEWIILNVWYLEKEVFQRPVDWGHERSGRHGDKEVSSISSKWRSNVGPNTSASFITELLYMYVYIVYIVIRTCEYHFLDMSPISLTNWQCTTASHAHYTCIYLLLQVDIPFIAGYNTLLLHSCHHYTTEVAIDTTDLDPLREMMQW